MPYLTQPACFNKALAFATKESEHRYIFFTVYAEREYPDGTVGYIHISQNTRIVREPFGDEEFYYFMLQNVRPEPHENCLPVPRVDGFIGHHKNQRCEGKWYTFNKCAVRVTDACRNKYGKYIPKADKNKDTVA